MVNSLSILKQRCCIIALCVYIYNYIYIYYIYTYTSMYMHSSCGWDRPEVRHPCMFQSIAAKIKDTTQVYRLTMAVKQI